MHVLAHRHGQVTREYAWIDTASVLTQPAGGIVAERRSPRF
jgi:hypothetical protein